MDMDMLNEQFCRKGSPDRTMFRIEDLENAMKELDGKVD